MNKQPYSPNFQGKNFRSKKNLENKDFSGADIRGIDFSRADLSNANFRKVQAGLPPLWKNILASFCFLLAFLAGLISAYGGAIIGNLLMGDTEQLSSFGIFAYTILAIYVFIVITRGLGSLKSSAEFIAISLITVTFLLVVISLAPENKTGSDIALGAVFTLQGLVGIIVGILDMALGVAIGKEIFLPKLKLITFEIAFFGAIVGSIAARQEGAEFIAGIAAFITIVLGIHIGLKASSSDEKYWLIRWLAINIVSWKSTKFVDANLTDADFTGADLTHTDFSNATLTRTCWSQAKGLDSARRKVSSSYEIVELSVGNSINPKAATLALQQLKKKYADRVELLAIEGTEQNNLKLHTKITESDISLQIADELKKMYRQNQLLPDSTIKQRLLEEKLQLLERILTKAVDKPTYQNINITRGNYNENIKGDYTDNSRNLDISGNAQVEASGASAFSLDNNDGTIANNVSQPPSNEPDKQKLKESLKLLQDNLSRTDLADEDKEDTLKQIKAISAALINSQDITQKK